MRMRRRSATTGLTANASLVLQNTVRVLYDLEHGAAMLSSRTATRSVALSRMSAANSSSELVIVLSLF